MNEEYFFYLAAIAFIYIISLFSWIIATKSFKPKLFYLAFIQAGSAIASFVFFLFFLDFIAENVAAHAYFDIIFKENASRICLKNMLMVWIIDAIISLIIIPFVVLKSFTQHLASLKEIKKAIAWQAILFVGFLVFIFIKTLVSDYQAINRQKLNTINVAAQMQA